MSTVRTHTLTEPAAGQTTLRDFFTVLFRRKWIVVFIPVITFLVVTWVNLKEPVRFSSSTRILLKRGTRENALEPGVTILPREEELASQVEIVKSVAVMRRAQLLLDQLPRKIHLNPGAVTAGVVGESNVVDLTYESIVPADCPVVADVLAQAFMEYHRRTFSVPSMGVFFQRQTDSAYTELESYRALKTTLLQNQGQVEPEELRKNIMQLLLQQQSALDQVRQRRVMVEAELENTRRLTGHKDLDLPFSPNTQAGGETWIVELKKQVQDLRIHLEELRSKYSDDHPQVLALEQQIVQVEAQLKRESRAHLLLEEGSLRVVRAQENQLTQSLTELQSRLQSYPDAQVRLEELNKLIELSEELYKQMRERQNQALVAGATAPDWSAHLLAPAAPALRINKHDYVRIALAPLLALAVSIGLAFFMDSLDHSLKSVREVEDVLGLTVIASVPEVK